MLNNKYREIEFSAGTNIESAIKELKSSKGLVCGTFNGQVLYSDIDDVDSAYFKIIGKTKAECDEDSKRNHEEYEKSQKEHKDSIPELTQYWIEKGQEILDIKYLVEWNKCVPIRLNDIYQGMELKACLDIIIKLNNDCTLEEAKVIIENQGHSGMSFGLVCSMVASFCDRGKEFVKFVK